VAEPHRQGPQRGYVLLPLLGTSPPPGEASLHLALYTGKVSWPSPAAVEANTRMTYEVSRRAYVAATRARDQTGTPTMGTRLQDKTAPVIGAASSIGRAIVTAFAAEAHMLSRPRLNSASPRLSIPSVRRAATRRNRSGSRWPGLFTHPRRTAMTDIPGRDNARHACWNERELRRQSKGRCRLSPHRRSRVRIWNRHRRRRPSD
jgi:hypothetical protein